MDLIDAFFEGDLDKVEKAFKEGADLNKFWRYAISNPKILDLFYKLGIDVNFQSEEGRTPLHYAISSVLSAVESLLEHGADPNLADKEGQSPLHKAIRYPEIIKLLLKYGANPNLQDNLGETPLFISVLSLFPESVSILLENGGNLDLKNNKGQSVRKLYQSFEKEPLTQLFSLKESEFLDISSPDKIKKVKKLGRDFVSLPYPFNKVVFNYTKGLDVVDRFLNLINYPEPEEIKKDIYFGRLLLDAVDREDLPRFRRLLKLRLNYNPEVTLDYILFRMPEKRGEDETKLREMIQLLLQAGTVPNMGNLTGAVRIGDLDLVTQFLNYVNLKDEEPSYSSPLLEAIAIDNLEITKLLLEHGADPNQRGYEYPLELAVTNSDYMFVHNQIDNRIVELLLEFGADPNILDYEGKSIIVEPILFKNIPLLKILNRYVDKKKLQPIYDINPSKLLQSLLSKNPNFDLINEQIASAICYLYKKGKDASKPEEITRDRLNEGYQDDMEIYFKIRDLCSSDLQRVQSGTAKPIFSNLPTYLSKRAKTKLNYLFNEVGYEPRFINKTKVPYFRNLFSDEGCFCLLAKFGVYENYYIPVVTYRPSLGTGYLGYMVVDPNTTRFLFYYWEPESPYLLFSRKTLVTRNKAHALYLLASEKEGKPTVHPDLKRFGELVKEELKIDVEEWVKILEEKERLLTQSNFTSWFRPMNENAEGYILQELDPAITNLAIELGYDCVIFTHEEEGVGNNRFSTEVLDVRTRAESIRNIFTAE